MRALVVDPSVTAQRIASKILLASGFEEVVVAPSLPEALQRWEENSATPFELVITEWELRPGTGIELTRDLRARPEGGAHMAVLMCTTRNTREAVTQAIEAGVDDYLVKPTDPGLLANRAKALMERAPQSASEEQAELPGQPEQAEQPEHLEQTDQPEQAEQPEQAGLPGQPDQPEEFGPAEPQEQPDQPLQEAA
jgi:DNA-binding response OmpR family regulator